MTSTETLDTRPTILVVDDDVPLRQQVLDYLTVNGCDVETVGDAASMDAALSRRSFDVIVLDVMMPGEDGLSVCRRLSSASSPAILIMSALGEDVDRIIGLEVGADDYLAKPCNPRELLARIRAVLRRRHERRASEGPIGAVCEFAGWRLDLVRRELRSPQGVVVNLSSGEFSMLRAFVERPQRVLTRDRLLDLARGPDTEAYDRAIDVQISRLRKKLDDGAGAQELIRTVRNEGYMFTVKVTRG